MAAGWDQRGFDSTLKELLSGCHSDAWPRSINKHALFVSLAAMQETERTAFEKITRELAQDVPSPRDGRAVSMGIALAAKRASKGWVGQGNLSGMSPSQRKKAQKRLSLSAWRKLVGTKLNKMVRGRAVSTAFIKSGWWFVVQKLGPIVGGKYDRSGGRGIPHRGQSKGRVAPATPGNFQVIIENTAASHSEKRGGFHRVGDPAFERALNRETAQMSNRIEDEMKRHVDKFNRSQH